MLGFLSVFAHGCEVRDYHQHRRNSKYLFHGANYDPFLDRDFDGRRDRNGKYRYDSRYYNDRNDYQDEYYDRQHKSHGR